MFDSQSGLTPSGLTPSGLTPSGLTRWLRPSAIATAALVYAAFHLLSGLAFVVTDPSPTLADNLARGREAFSAAFLIAAVAALTLVVDRFLRVVVHHILPSLKRG